MVGPALTPAAETIVGSQGRPPVPVTAPMTAAQPAVAVTAPIGSANPVTIMGSGPYKQHSRASFSQPIPSSGPRAMVHAAAAAPPRQPAPANLPSLRWWIIGGSALGVILTTIIVLATRSDEPAVKRAPVDAAAASPAIDAAATRVTPDAAELVDAAEPDAPAATPDAAPADDDVSELSKMPDDTKPAAPTPAPRPRMRTREDLNAAYRERRFRDIVVACTQLGAAGDKAVVCTLAACWNGNKGAAQTWFRNIAPKQRDGTIAECKKRGAVIKDVCVEDLTACRQ
jgi:hypothetical protein